MSKLYSLFVSCPKGLEYLLETETKALGFQVTRVSPQGVYGEGSLKTLYDLCLWSRLANRIQIILFAGSVADKTSLYALCHQFAWDGVFSLDKTFAIEFHGTTSAINNTMFGAQVVKDAIVDYWQEKSGQRPDVSRNQPDILLHVHLKKGTATVSLDATGYSLHQRGYRLEAGNAPLKENVAAALLVRAHWPELSALGHTFHDPFCGSGTIVIEAALMALSIAPGLLRQDQAIQAWNEHNHELWQEARKEAEAKQRLRAIKLKGSDNDRRAISMAEANAKRARVTEYIEFSSTPFESLENLATEGLIVTNPPYGERLEDEIGLLPLMQDFGQLLARQFAQWQVAVLTAKPMLAKAIGLRAHKQYTFYNGQLECKLYCFDLKDNQLRVSADKQWSAGAEMFANRLRKNLTHLQKWAKRQAITCFRVYDADLSEYAYAIDLYNDYAVLQEYAPPATIPAHVADKRRLDVLQVVPQVLGLPSTHIVHKQRQQQKGTAQYERLTRKCERLTVQEGPAKLLVNLYDYLDTGLFLDHRPLRLQFGKLARGTRFLNLFCYTATASVHAALAGATTTNVDLSRTYLAWAQDNFYANDLDCARHQFVQFDCLEWLKLSRDQFDVIFLDPPSFSNSKRMQTTLDIQRDHVSLIHAAIARLAPQGILYFSTNLRSFKLDPGLTEQYRIDNISRMTLDEDFKRNAKIHQSFKIHRSRHV